MTQEKLISFRLHVRLSREMALLVHTGPCKANVNDVCRFSIATIWSLVTSAAYPLCGVLST